MKVIIRYVKDFINYTTIKIGTKKNQYCIITFKKDSADIDTKTWQEHTYLKFSFKIPIFINYKYTPKGNGN